MTTVSLRRRMLAAAAAAPLVAGAVATSAYALTAQALQDNLDANILAVAAASDPPASALGPQGQGRPGPAGAGNPPAPGVPDRSTDGYIVVYTNPQGVVVSRTGPRDGPALDGPAMGWSDVDGWRAYTADRPRGGTVTVAADASQTAYARTVAARALAAALAIVTAAMWATLAWVWWRGVRPLARITGTARDVAAGDSSSRVPTAGLPAEALSVAEAVNALLDAQARVAAQQDALVDQQRQFLLDASHELRTPLTSIHGWAQLLRDHAVPDERLDEAHARIVDESARMTRLVAGLMAVARAEQPDAAEQSRGSAAADLARIAHAVAEDHTVVDPTRPVRVETPEEAPARIDPDAATQVVANLLSNLRAHTPAGTRALLRITAGENQWILDYADDGPGVANPQAVWQRFWQADPSRAGAGSGLGMSLVEALVRQHGGSVAAAAVDPHGLALRIRLPRA